MTEDELIEKLWRNTNLTKREAAEFIQEAIRLGRSQVETSPE